jgi:hypothetical protein
MVRVILAAVVLLWAGGAWAADPYMSIQGVWVWNKAASQPSMVAASYREARLEYTKDDGKAFAYKQVSTKTDGSVEHLAFEGAFDGEPRKDMGMDFRYWRLSPSAIALTFEGKGIHGQEVVAVTKDRLIFAGALTDPSGKTIPYIDVWDRAK